MSNKPTAFAGFLDGYKARNIAVSTSSVTYHFEEMRNATTDILSAQRLKNAPKELLARLDHLAKMLSPTQDDFLSLAISCGEELKTILLISKENGDPTELLKEVKMKRLVYHYLEFAELSEDKQIGDLAIAIAEIFEK
jgi:hypothetical protein